MTIEHLSLVTRDLERLKDFYVRFFDAKATRWVSPDGTGVLYFLDFGEGSRLEMEQVLDAGDNATRKGARVGMEHFAFLAKSRAELDAKTRELEEAGVTIVAQPADFNGEFYESCFLDPDGNIVELSVGAQYL